MLKSEVREMIAIALMQVRVTVAQWALFMSCPSAFSSSQPETNCTVVPITLLASTISPESAPVSLFLVDLRLLQSVVDAYRITLLGHTSPDVGD